MSDRPLNFALHREMRALYSDTSDAEKIEAARRRLAPALERLATMVADLSCAPTVPLCDKALVQVHGLTRELQTMQQILLDSSRNPEPPLAA